MAFAACTCCESSAGDKVEAVVLVESEAQNEGPVMPETAEGVDVDVANVLKAALEVNLHGTDDVDARDEERQCEKVASPLGRLVSSSSQLPNEFEVIVEKVPRLGMDLMKSKDSQALVVVGVTDGTVQLWNTQELSAGRANTVVRRGDRVVEVNGRGRDNGAEIIEALTSAQGTVTLVMLRVHEFMAVNIAHYPMERHCVECQEDEAGRLMVTEVGPKTNSSLQPDVELRVGDQILKVNGTTSNLKEELETHFTLTLRVRRPKLMGP